MANRSVILGAGAYGEVYLHYLRESGIEVVGFLDDDPSKAGAFLGGVPVLGATDRLALMKGQGVKSVYAPIGANDVRRRLLAKARAMGFETPCYRHPSAIVASDLKCGAGVYILAGTIIMPTSSLGDDVMASIGVHIAHHVDIRSGAFLSTGVSIGAGVKIMEEVTFGMNATAVTGKCRIVGQAAVVGACSNLVADVPAGVTVAGNPARILTKS